MTNAMRVLLSAIFIAFGVIAASAQDKDATVFDVDALPEASRNAPENFDLTNPRGAMRSFTRAVEERRFEDAAAALFPPEGVETPAETLALQLGEVIDRQLWINGSAISDRPDALVEAVGDNPRAGEPKRSIALGSVDMDGFPVTIRLNRYREDGTEPLWLFSKDTVAATPAMYARYGPGWVE